MAECTETGGGVAADAAARGEAGQTSVWTHVTTTQAETQKYGISIDAQKVSNLRYADDTALCGKYHEEICYLLDAINERGKEKKMKLNAREKKLCIFEKVSIRMLQLMASSWKESMVLYILAHAKRVAENVKLKTQTHYTSKIQDDRIG